jgi:hypothetical protein
MDTTVSSFESRGCGRIDCGQRKTPDVWRRSDCARGRFHRDLHQQPFEYRRPLPGVGVSVIFTI